MTESSVHGLLASPFGDIPEPLPTGPPFPASLHVKDNFLVLKNEALQRIELNCGFGPKSVWQGSSNLFFISGVQQGNQIVFALRCSNPATAQVMAHFMHSIESGEGLNQGKINTFDQKTDKGSSELYFHYYGMLQHQQNMLQDYTRTGTYYAAILENRVDFEGKVVMDVGAGSGILSLFAAQAGARKVYAVEASGMAKFARKLADSNPGFGERVVVVEGKVEEVRLPEKADILVSEPLGTLLVNERMIETYLYARDHFLKPGGKMFPQVSRVHVGAFYDEALYSEILNKGAFWLQQQFYGVNVTSLHSSAVEGYFAQVVVDAFDPSVIISSNLATKVFDFATISEKDLYDINIPLNLQLAAPCTIHGVACWFDVCFPGSAVPRWLSTAPGLPTTHWFQLRCVLQQPIFVATPNAQVTGELRLVAHNRQSYDVHLNLQGPPLHPNGPPQTSSGKFDLKEPYYRQLTVPHPQPQQQTQQQAQQQNQQQTQQQAQPHLQQQQYQKPNGHPPRGNNAQQGGFAQRPVGPGHPEPMPAAYTNGVGGHH